MTVSTGIGRKLRTVGIGCAHAALAVAALAWLLVEPAAAADQDDMVKFVKEKRAELIEKEETLKKEEERLAVLMKDIDGRIESYTKLLARIESELSKAELVKDERVAAVVKAYEAMPPEDAAERLSALDFDTALTIMLRMKSKKTGAIMALMSARKAADFTKRMTTLNRREME